MDNPLEYFLLAFLQGHVFVPGHVTLSYGPYGQFGSSTFPKSYTELSQATLHIFAEQPRHFERFDIYKHAYKHIPCDISAYSASDKHKS